MQSQPLVESSSIHHQSNRHYRHQQRSNLLLQLPPQTPVGHNHHIKRNRLARHPLTSFNRLRSAVRNVAHTFNHFHHHHSVDSVPKSADQAVVSMSGHQPQQHHHMGRLRKFTGAGLLNRFRSISKTASDDDESPSARVGTSNVVGCPKTSSSSSSSRNVSQCDPVTSGEASASGVTAGPTWLSDPFTLTPVDGDQDNNGEIINSAKPQLVGDKMEKPVNGDQTAMETKHFSTDMAGDSNLSVDGDARQRQTDELEACGKATEHETDYNAHSSSPVRPLSAAPYDDSDTDGVRVYKKVSTNGKLVLYLINRDLIITKDSVSPLHAVVTVDAEELRNKKIFAQILLTFRYGRDDEEVMGLKLSNESVLCVEQVYPLLPGVPPPQPLTKCQEVLVKRLGPQAHIINLKLNHTVPASVRLLPAKEYRGAAIGINYDLRVYTAESIEEKPHRRSQVRMAIRLVQYAPMDIQQKEAPRLQLEKHFLLREGALQVEAGLDHQWYTQGSPIVVCLRIHNRSSRIVKKIQIRAIQHVDVTMFSNGKFKNTIAVSEEHDGLPLTTGNTLDRRFPLALMENGGGRHWVALEDRYGRLTATLASTTLKSAPNERHFFAIYISYYVKVRLVVSGVGGDVSLKIPFILMRDGPESNPISLDTIEDAYHSNRNPERPCSPAAISNVVSDVDEHHAPNTEKCQDDAKVSRDTPIVEKVDAQLHAEPKTFNSDETDLPSCEDLPPTCSSPSKQSGAKV